MDDVETIFERLERISAGERRRRRSARPSRGTTVVERVPASD